MKNLYYVPLRINRYIMECKCSSTNSRASSALRINRYIMECKCLLAACFSSPFCELIDTLWNVNLQVPPSGMHEYKRINRYIMECK